MTATHQKSAKTRKSQGVEVLHEQVAESESAVEQAGVVGLRSPAQVNQDVADLEHGIARDLAEIVDLFSPERVQEDNLALLRGMGFGVDAE